MNITLRPATDKDTATILKFIQGLAKYEKLEADCIATEDKLRATLFGERAYAEVILAFKESTPVGFALFFHTYSTFLAKPGLYLEDLYVDEHYRSQGIGKQLLLEIIRTAHQRDCGRVEWAALDWNTPAIDFYKSIGAETLDDWITFRLTENKINHLVR